MPAPKRRRAELDAARNTALLQLVTSWYDVLWAQTSTALALSNVDRMRVLADGAGLRFESGVDSGGDVARARVLSRRGTEARQSAASAS